jgi:hypothetical protein
MTDTRSVGQELQEQVLAAARNGRRRVTTTVRNARATAQMIRPQLPAMPPITIKLPRADQLAQLTEAQFNQLREKAPALIARLPSRERLAELTEQQLSQLREKAPGLLARLPDADQLRAGATDFAEQVQFVQRQVADRVRTVASPLAHQAAAAFAQATAQVKGSGGKASPAAVAANGAAAARTAAKRTDSADQDKPAGKAKPAAKAKPATKRQPTAKAKASRPAPRGTGTAKKSKPTAK